MAAIKGFGKKSPSGGKRRWFAALQWLRGQPAGSDRDFLIAVAEKKAPIYGIAAKIKPVPKFKKLKGDLIEDCETLCKAIVFDRDLDAQGRGYCITCGKPGTRQEGAKHRESIPGFPPLLQWGHFVKQNLSAWLRFDTRNTAMQCDTCNGRGVGMRFEFGAALDKNYGEGFAGRLEEEAKKMRWWLPTTEHLEERKAVLIQMIETKGIPMPKLTEAA